MTKTSKQARNLKSSDLFMSKSVDYVWNWTNEDGVAMTTVHFVSGAVLDVTARARTKNED